MKNASEVPNGDVDMYVIIGGEKNPELVHVIRKTPKRMQVDYHFHNSSRTWERATCQYRYSDKEIWDVSTEFFLILRAQVDSFDIARAALEGAANAEHDVIYDKYFPHFEELKATRCAAYVELLRCRGFTLEES